METFALNIPIFAFAAALIWTGIVCWQGKGRLGEVLARTLLLLPNGLGGLWTFCFIVFFSHGEAAFFSLPDSEFQYREGIALLAMGISGIIAFWASFEFCLGLSVIAIILYTGFSIIHLVEIFYFRNVAPGNIGFLMTFDLLLPALLALSLYFWHCSNRRRR